MALANLAFETFFSRVKGRATHTRRERQQRELQRRIGRHPGIARSPLLHVQTGGELGD